jgi:hypothetical protein
VDDGPDSRIRQRFVSFTVFPASALPEHVAMSSEAAQILNQLQRQHIQGQRKQNLLLTVKDLEGSSFKVDVLYLQRSDLARSEPNLHRKSDE